MTDFRPLSPDEVPLALAALDLAFGGDGGTANWDVESAVLDPTNTLAAFDPGVVVTGGWFDLTMTLPGAVAPVAGVTWVSVAPTHRRRGLLRELMTRQLTDLHEQGRPLAALWASEGAIYQRFGYGLASWQHSVDVKRGAAFTRPVDVSGLRLEPPSQDLLAPVFDSVVGSRPGWSARDDAWWAFRLHDPKHERGGASPLRCVVDGTDGYALYSTKQEWGGTGPLSSVNVRELVAATPVAEARLWRYLIDLDLIATIRARNLPVDGPLLHLLAEPRAAGSRVGDALWFRLVDVSGLALRRYATEVDVVVDVLDATCPWNAGTWRLSGGPSGAECSRTTAAPDLRLDARELGAAFLGGTSLTARAAAGGVEELTPGALQSASVAFGPLGRVAHCPMIF